MSNPWPRLAKDRNVLVIECALLILAFYVLRLSLLRTRTFDPDEFQHLHAAWAVHQGLLPFRDFFEHHMPGIQYLLAPMLAAFHVNAAADDAIRFLFVARTLMWLFTGISVMLTIVWGTQYGGSGVGWLSGALLSTSIVFVGRTLEIRPDTPGLMFWLASLVTLTAAIQPLGAGGRSQAWFAASGFCFGCGVFFNQKLLLAVPGLVACAGLYLCDRRGATGLKSKLLNLMSFSSVSALPLLAMAAFFWWQGGLDDLVHGVLTNNLGWPQEVSASSTLRWMLLRDPLLCAFSIAGLVQTGLLIAHERSGPSALAILVIPTLSLLAGLAVIPTPYPQYMLMVLPAGAVLGARFIWTLASDFSKGRPDVVSGYTTESLVVMASFVTVAAAGLNIARPFYLHAAVYPMLGIIAITTALVLARRHQPHWAAAVLLGASSVYGVQQLRWMQGLSNADTLQQMRYVHSNTRPTDRVLDGFSGLAWFRPNASFYPFLHAGIRGRLTDQETEQIVALLTRCDQRPKLVILDDNLRALSPAVAPLVARYYQPTPFPLLWVRNEDGRLCSMSGSHAEPTRT